LICIDASLGCGLKHQIPRGGGDFRITEPLPEFDVEFASGEFASDNARHDELFRHLASVYNRPEFQSRVCPRATM
jgi:hypothetical protein